MYKIVVNNEQVAIVEKLRYIKVNPKSGCFIQAKNRKDAQGIAVNGTPYNIDGHAEINGQPTAYIFEDDAGIFVFNNQKNVEELIEYILEMSEIIYSE